MHLHVWKEKPKMKKMIFAVAGAGLIVSSAFAQENRIQQGKKNQQQRIANGVENGSLTPKETAHLENQQAKLNHEIHADRKANGSNLTNNEKRQINRQQNHLSRNIYRQKHDGQHQ
jgi:hypothetical protein